MEEEKKNGMKYKKAEEGVRERSSTFSLGFPAISPSNPGEARGKVDPHCKGYAWVPRLWNFDKLQEVGVFSYLVISCLKIHENGLFWSCEIGNGYALRFQGSVFKGLMRGLSLDSPRLVVGLPCVVRNWLMD